MSAGADDTPVTSALPGLKQSLRDALDPDLMINVRQSVHRQLPVQALGDSNP
jgi:hypothetical protein